VNKSQFDLTQGVDPAPRRISGIARLGAVSVAFAMALAACGPGSSAAPSGGAASAPASAASTAPSASTGGESEAPSGSPAESPSGSPAESGGTTGGGTVEPPAGDVAFEFWTGLTGADGDEMEALVQQFNSENPNVQVTLQRLPEYYTQINNAVAAGTPPAMMIMHIDQLALFAANGVVQPVGDLVEQLGVSEADFSEAVWAGTQWQGEQYSIPLDVHPATLYYNKQYVPEPPTDQESFEAALQACKDAGITGPVWSNHFFSASLFWASLFYQGGGEWTNEDYSEATFNSDAGVQASTYMRSLIEQGLHPQDVEADAEVSSFESGESCMAITGIWQTTRLAEAIGDDFGAAPIPQIFDEPGVWGGSHTLAISSTAEGDTLQGVQYFIQWLSENSAAWGAAGQIPARNSAREAPEFTELEHMPDIAEQYDAAKFPPPIPGSADMLGGPGGVTEKLLETLTGGGDPKPGLDEAAATYTEILQENKEQYGY
jgi:multiple sugar transport system substrate-binding protein